ncbi:hypothetical protein [Nocardia sienata]|uniref:hypothetical protein n=1 Tax=Nocardia sienata TaxID=248552 RepID=UPI000AF9BDE6|nr:hypothetical protein [Nocardia sienata]
MNAVDTDPSDAPGRVGDVVRDVIAQVAPEELPMVDRLRPLGDRAAVRILSRRKRSRDLLGFGIDEIVVLASPVVWIVVSEAVARFTDSAITGGGRAARSGLRRLLRRGPVEQEIPPLDGDQIAEIRAQVLDSALRSGMDADRAAIVADAVAGRLALAARAAPERPPEPGGPAGQAVHGSEEGSAAPN